MGISSIPVDNDEEVDWEDDDWFELDYTSITV
jgi:hypothetical protein